MDVPVVVLMAEDERVLRDLLKAAFEDGGFAVVLASEGKEAMSALDSNRGVRALVTDIQLGPDMTGWDVARHARELSCGICDGPGRPRLGIPRGAQ